MLLMLLMSFLLFMMLLILLNVDVVTVNLPGLHLNSYASHFAAGSSGFKAVVPSNTTCVKKGKKSVYMKLANKIGIKWYIKV